MTQKAIQVQEEKDMKKDMKKEKILGECGGIPTITMNKTTEIVFILDRSGSMGGLESDTIGGFNSMIEKQKNEPGECFVTTVLFDGVAVPASYTGQRPCRTIPARVKRCSTNHHHRSRTDD